MKNVKRLIGIVLAIVAFVVICRKIDYALVDYAPWYRILMKSYYEQESIDNVFFGSSHVFCDVNPEIIDKRNGMNNFNMSTSGQRWDDTYYLLKEVTSKHDIKHAYIECYYWDITDRERWIPRDKQVEVVDFLDDPEAFKLPWQITYEMKPSINSFMMLANSSNLDYSFETWIPFVRFRQNLFNWEKIEKNIKDKNSRDYLEYRYHAENADVDGNPWTTDFLNKGFRLSRGGRLLDREKIYFASIDLKKCGIGKKSEGYYRKTIEYCKRNNIGVTLFVSPIYDLQLISTGDYDSYVVALRKLAEEYEVDLYDFNLIKNEFLDIKDGEYFMDVGHLNGDGAELFSSVLWDVLSSSKEENIYKFFDSYDEKLMECEPEIYGVYYEDISPGIDVNEDGSPIYTTRRYTIASNRVDMEYKIVCTIDNGDENVENPKEVIQEYDINNSFDLPINEHGSMSIYGKYGGEDYRIIIDY